MNEEEDYDDDEPTVSTWITEIVYMIVVLAFFIGCVVAGIYARKY